MWRRIGAHMHCHLPLSGAKAASACAELYECRGKCRCSSGVSGQVLQVHGNEEDAKACRCAFTKPQACQLSLVCSLGATAAEVAVVPG